MNVEDPRLKSNTPELAELIILAQSGDMDAMLRLVTDLDGDDIVYVDNIQAEMDKSKVKPLDNPNLEDSN